MTRPLGNASFDDLFAHFFADVRAGAIEIYNRSSLQHELGLALRRVLQDQAKVQFDRPVTYFGLNANGLHRPAISIAAFNPADTSRKVALEVVYLDESAPPVALFQAGKTISFLEQLCLAGFNRGYCVLVAHEGAFNSADDGMGLARAFHGEAPLHGIISRLANTHPEHVEILGSYSLNWNAIDDTFSYAVAKMKA